MQSSTEGCKINNWEDVRFTIVYDNTSYVSTLETSWGFSCYIETSRGNILFDTGWNGNTLLKNMTRLGISPDTIDKLVLSHNHWDHIGGLNHIITANTKLEAYIPTSFSKHLKDEVSKQVRTVEVYEPVEVLPGTWSTGEHGEHIKEQALLVGTKKGFVLVTGCSHPGLEVVLADARNHGEVYGVLGGFHGFHKFDALKGLQFVMPCHCTQHMDEIEVYYNHVFVGGGVGKKVTI